MQLRSERNRRQRIDLRFSCTSVKRTGNIQKIEFDSRIRNLGRGKGVSSLRSIDRVFDPRLSRKQKRSLSKHDRKARIPKVRFFPKNVARLGSSDSGSGSDPFRHGLESEPRSFTRNDFEIPSVRRGTQTSFRLRKFIEGRIRSGARDAHREPFQFFDFQFLS